MISSLCESLPVKYVSFHSPASTKWDSQYYQFVWHQAADGRPQLYFVPARLQMHLPADAGPVQCLCFLSTALDSSSGLFPSPMPISYSGQIECILKLLTELSEEQLTNSVELRITGLILCLISEFYGEAPREQNNTFPMDRHSPDTASIKHPKGSFISGRPLIYAVRYMHRNIQNPLLSLFDIAHSIGYHPNYFCHEFSKIFMQSPIRYLNEMRLKQTIMLLKQTDYSVKEICKIVGVANPNRLCSMVKGITSMTPTEYRRFYKLNTSS